MASTTNNLTLILGVADKQLQAGIKRAQAAIKGLGDTAQTTEKRTNRSFNRIAVNSQRSFGTARKSVARFSEALRTSIVNIKFLASALVGGALLKGVVKFSSNFETSLANINTLLDKGSVSIGQYRQKLLDLSVKSSKDLGDLSKALYQVISAGISTAKESEKAFAVLERAQAAAVAGLAETEEAANAILSFVQAFKEQGLSASRAADILQKTVEKGRTTWSQLAVAIGRVTPLAANFGMTAEEVGASLVTLTKAGLNTNEAVTGMRAILSGLAKPTKRARDILGRLGLDFSSARVQVIGFRGVLEELNRTTGGNVEIMSQLFPNIRALLPAIVQAGDDFGTFDQALKDIEGSSGAVDEATRKIQGTFAYTAAVLKSNFQRVLVQIGEEGGVLDRVGLAFRNLSDSLAYGMEVNVLGWSINIKEALAEMLKAMVTVAEFITGPLATALTIIGVAFVGKLGAGLIVATGRMLTFIGTLKGASLSMAALATSAKGMSAGILTSLQAMGASSKIQAVAASMGGAIGTNMAAATTTVLSSSGVITKIGYGLRGLMMGAIRFAGPIAIIASFLPMIIDWAKGLFGGGGEEEKKPQDKGTAKMADDVSKDASKRISSISDASDLADKNRDPLKTQFFQKELNKLNSMYADFQREKGDLDQEGVAKYRDALDQQVKATKEAYRMMANISIEGANEQQQAVELGERVRLNEAQRATLQQAFGGKGDTSTFRITDLVNKEIDAITRWRAANDKEFRDQAAKFEIRAEAIRRVEEALTRSENAALSKDIAELRPQESSVEQLSRFAPGPLEEGKLASEIDNRILKSAESLTRMVATEKSLAEAKERMISQLKDEAKADKEKSQTLQADIGFVQEQFKNLAFNLELLRNISSGEEGIAPRRASSITPEQRKALGIEESFKGFLDEGQARQIRLMEESVEFFKETGKIPSVILEDGKTQFSKSIKLFFEGTKAQGLLPDITRSDRLGLKTTTSAEFPILGGMTSEIKDNEGRIVSQAFSGMPSAAFASIPVEDLESAAYSAGVEKTLSELRKRLELNIREGFVEGFKQSGTEANLLIPKLNEQFKNLRVVPPENIEAISDLSQMFVEFGEEGKKQTEPLYNFLLKNGKLLGSTAKDNLQTEGHNIKLQARRIVLGKQMFGTEQALKVSESERLAALRGGTSDVIKLEGQYQKTLLETLGIASLFARSDQKQYAGQVQRINNQQTTIKNLKKSLELARKNAKALAKGAGSSVLSARRRLAEMTRKMLEDEKKLRTEVAVLQAKLDEDEVKRKIKTTKSINAIIKKSSRLEGLNAAQAAKIREQGYKREIALELSLASARSRVSEEEIKKEQQKTKSDIANEKAKLDAAIKKAKLSTKGGTSKLELDARAAFEKKRVQLEERSAQKILKIEQKVQRSISDGLMRQQALRAKISKERMEASSAAAKAAIEQSQKQLDAIERESRAAAGAFDDAQKRLETSASFSSGALSKDAAQEWFNSWAEASRSREAVLKKSQDKLNTILKSAPRPSDIGVDVDDARMTNVRFGFGGFRGNPPEDINQAIREPGFKSWGLGKPTVDSAKKLLSIVKVLRNGKPIEILDKEGLKTSSKDLERVTAAIRDRLIDQGGGDVKSGPVAGVRKALEGATSELNNLIDAYKKIDISKDGGFTQAQATYLKIQASYQKLIQLTADYKVGLKEVEVRSNSLLNTEKAGNNLSISINEKHVAGVDRLITQYGLLFGPIEQSAKTLQELERTLDSTREKVAQTSRELANVKVPAQFSKIISDFLLLATASDKTEMSLAELIATNPELKAFSNVLKSLPEEQKLIAEGLGLLDPGFAKLGIRASSVGDDLENLAGGAFRGAESIFRVGAAMTGLVVTIGGMFGTLGIMKDEFVAVGAAGFEFGKGVNKSFKQFSESMPFITKGIAGLGQSALGAIGTLFTLGLNDGPLGWAYNDNLKDALASLGEQFPVVKKGFETVEKPASALGKIALGLAGTFATLGAWDGVDDSVFGADAKDRKAGKQTGGAVGMLSEGFDQLVDSGKDFWNAMTGPKATAMYKGMLGRFKAGLLSVALEFGQTLQDGMMGALTGDFTQFTNKIMGVATKFSDMIADEAVTLMTTFLDAGKLMGPIIKKSIGPVLKVPGMVLSQINKMVMGPALKAIAAPMQMVTSGISEAFTSLTNSADLTSAREKINREADASIAVLKGQLDSATSIEEYQRIQKEIEAEELERRKAVNKKGKDPEDILEKAFNKALTLVNTIVEKLPDMITKVMDMLIEHLPALIAGAVEALALALVAFAEKLPELMTVIIQSLIDALPMLIDALVTSIPLILDALLLGLITILENIGDIATNLLTGLIQSLSGIIITIIRRAPEIIAGIVQAIPDLITALIESIPVLIEEIARMLPVLIVALIEAIPRIIAALVKALPQLVWALIKLLPMVVVGFVKGIGKGLADVFGPLATLGDAFSDLADVFVEVGKFFKEIVSAGFGSKGALSVGLGALIGKGWAWGDWGLWHQGGMVGGGDRNPGMAAALHRLGAPAFAEGGMVMRNPLDGMRRAFMGIRKNLVDDVPAVLQAGESVLNRSATAAIGGAPAVNALNSGSSDMVGGTQEINVSLNASGDGINQAAAALLPFLISGVTVEAVRPGSGLRNTILTSGTNVPMGTKKRR